jgi:hypothetical protein
MRCYDLRPERNHNPCVGGSNPSSATNVPHTTEPFGNARSPRRARSRPGTRASKTKFSTSIRVRPKAIDADALGRIRLFFYAFSEFIAYRILHKKPYRKNSSGIAPAAALFRAPPAADKVMRSAMKVFGSRAWTGIEKLWLAIVMLLAVTAVALDIFVSIGVYAAPAAVGHVACILRPIGVVARPLFRQQWIDYISTQCLTGPVEPAISMINLMIKSSFAVVVFALVIGPIIYSYFTAPRDSLSEKYRNLSKKQACVKELKALLFGGSIFVTLPVVVWILITIHAPQKFNPSIIGKAVEDGTILLGLLATCIVLFIIILPFRLLGLYFVDDQK